MNILDPWVLVGSYLSVADLKSFFSVSKLQARVDRREDFWQAICQRNYGNWILSEFGSLLETSGSAECAWRQVTKQLTYCIQKSWSAIDSQFYGPQRKVYDSLRKQLYIRSPERATVYYGHFGDLLLHNTRPGDIYIRPASPPSPNQLGIEQSYLFLHGAISDHSPPAAYCWPNKPIEYCRVLNRVFIHILDPTDYTTGILVVEGIVRISDRRHPQQILSMELDHYMIFRGRHFPNSVQDLHLVWATNDELRVAVYGAPI